MDEREKLLQQLETEVQRTVDAWPRHVQAICYRYLYHDGLRISDTVRLIESGLREALGNGHR